MESHQTRFIKYLEEKMEILCIEMSKDVWRQNFCIFKKCPNYLFIKLKEAILRFRSQKGKLDATQLRLYFIKAFN